MKNAPLVSRVQPSEQLTLTIGLVIPNNAALTEAATQISDPNSPSYRKYLTPEQVADQFGATPADYQSVLDWAQAHNLTATAHRNRFVATVAGSVGDIETALNIHLNYRVRPDATQFFAPDAEPSIELSVPVEHVGGLDNFARPESAGGSGPGGAYQGTDFRNAYAPQMTLTGTGQKIGIFMLDGFAQSDINGYATETGQSFLSVQVIPSSALPLTPGEEGTLDVEASLSMAPGAQVVAFVGTPTAILTNMTDHPDIKQFTSSWFWYNGTTTDTNLMLTLSMQGQSFFQASGDSGAYPVGAYPTYVSGSIDCRQFPWITTVGGTSLNMSGSGTSYGSLETAWSGSSGGIETSVTIPSYQSGIAGVNGASTTQRNVPDVSAQAADVNIFYAGSQTQVGGTSLATPLWAGYMALVNELAAKNGKSSVGFANPALYAIASTSSYDTEFHDVSAGCAPGKKISNVYCAAAGYDLVTGLGSPQNSLVYTLAGVPEPVITKVSPNEGSLVGGPVTVNGHALQSSFQFNFGGTPAASVSCSSSTSCTMVAPAHKAGTVDVILHTPWGKSAAVAVDQFTYYAPSITHISPSVGPTVGGQTVTLTGSGLDSSMTVKFGTTPTTYVFCSDSTSCEVSSPAGTGSVNITATLSGSTSAADSANLYTYAVFPSVTSVSPYQGPVTGGITVTITGTNFSTAPGGTTILFGTLPATAVTCSITTQCTATAPVRSSSEGYLEVSVTATVNGHTSIQFVPFQFGTPPPPPPPPPCKGTTCH